MTRRIFPTILGKEGVGISGTWNTAQILVFFFFGYPMNCLGTSGMSVSMLIYYNEHKMRLKFYWKSDLLPSWT